MTMVVGVFISLKNSAIEHHIPCSSTALRSWGNKCYSIRRANRTEERKPMHFSILALMLVGVLFPGAAQYAFGSTEPYCYGKTSKSASTALRPTYVFTAKCDLPQTRLN